MKQLNDKLDSISNTIATINATVKSINERLEELIKALHDYDDDLSYEPQQGACSKHDEASWEQEDELNKRMDIIGQNGNTGEHYTSNYDDYSSFKRNEHKDEFDDYGKRNSGKRVGKDKDNNNPANKRGGKKSSIVEHQKYPPHKH
jgi:hypothetical protein